MTKKINLSQFGHNVQKYHVIFVTASFNNNKWSKCIRKQKKECSCKYFPRR